MYTLITAITIAASLLCVHPEEKAVSKLAARVAPEYASRIVFKHKADTCDSYSIQTRGRKIIISGSSTSAMSTGLGRYLSDCCGADYSWERSHSARLPEVMPLPDSTLSGRALVRERFFLNYCTFGYTMPWWTWEDWEHFIDWMALQGINMPLAITGQEAVWQELWRQNGLSDEQISSWFTGPAHLPWHRMCNIDGVDAPLPQGWIDSQEKLQQLILGRERELGMHPVLPAFNGHVPEGIKNRYPDAQITRIKGWGGFPKDNMPYFLSPQDSLFEALQKQFLSIQERKYGTDHIYGFDLFNEVDPPSWDPETLADISRKAYGSISAHDPLARWLQMGWMFYYDRKHWSQEIIEAYQKAVPQGRVTILDYYTENVPVWAQTDSFYGQPYIFCYLGNFGGNTRLAGPFRKESGRISEALGSGGASGIGCTLEGFGINRWFYEYVLSRAWEGSAGDEAWLKALDRRHASPHGFWQHMADSIYTRGSFSEGALVCSRPCMEGRHDWRVHHQTAYAHSALANAWEALLEAPQDSDTWRFDAVAIGCQVLGNHFADLRDRFARAFKEGNAAEAERTAEDMRALLADIDALADCEPTFRMSKWLKEAEAMGSDEQEKQYYRHNAWHLLTTWGYTQNLNDYASRLWSGLISKYYAMRWDIFLRDALTCLHEGKEFSQQAFDTKMEAWERGFVDSAPELHGPEAEANVPELCKSLLHKWLRSRKLTVMTWNVGAFSKYCESTGGVARAILKSRASFVALNELDSCNRRHNFFQLKALSDSLGGWDHHFTSSFPFAGGGYGNGIVCREQVKDRYKLALPRFDGSEPRSVAVVETESCVFASVHLDYTGKDARLEQARLINDWFTAKYAGSGKLVLLCGDMNSLPDSPVLDLLKEKWTLLSGTDYTYPTKGAERCIDYILALKSGAAARCISTAVLTEGNELLSDHFPILLTLEY
ncbi:MAG: alpha-N-acetylglucosaminidase C-terminal domain-containing protein [Bacteroidales bacterium]|nr:alpha-N-acetylglucosaminidase C-terminal domain-containing protein [Bacteroidales bacterium]